MMGLIQKYDLDANTPLDVIPMAREKITDAQDYLRFLELSLEGRIYGDYGAMLQNEKTTFLNNAIKFNRLGNRLA